MADEPKLVTALEVRLNAFEKQLKDAGVIAEREVKNIENTFAKANPVFGGAFLGTFLGNVARDAAKELISFVTSAIERFKELARVSKLANVAMQELFGLQEAAHKLGAPIEAVNASVRNLAELLDQMKRGESNSLSKLLDANPEALKGMNREALTFQQTLGIIANLVQNADTEIQKIDIAKAAGQAESMVAALEKGGKALDKLQKEAAAAAPDLERLANQAKDFDKAWTDAIDHLKAYMVTGFVEAFHSAIQDTIREVLQLLNLFKGGVFTGGPINSTGLVKRIQDFQNTLNDARFGKNFNFETAGSVPAALATRRSGDVAGGGTTTRDPSRPISNVPLSTTGGDERSRLDSAIDRIEKRTAALKKENEMINEGTEAREAAVIKEELLTIAKQQGGVVTAEQTKRIDELSAAYGRAAAAIEQSRAPLETFARESANVSKQMNSLVAASLNNITSELANVVTGSKSAKEAFGAMAKFMADELAKLAIRAALTGPLAKAMGGMFSVTGGSAAGFNFFGAAEGGTFGAGRWGVVGEKGPELIQTHAGGGVSVYPTKLPGFADGGFLPAPSGGATMQGAQIITTINAQGADKAGLARVEAEVIKLNRSLETRAVRAVSDASSRGHNVITRR